MNRVLFSFLLMLNWFIVSGQLRVNAHVKYQREDKSYSEYVYREITLRTGAALNRVTKSSTYDIESDYALIWYGEGQVVIIKLQLIIKQKNRYLVDIERSDLQLFLMFREAMMEGYDQDGDFWKLCFLNNEKRSLCD